MTIDFSINIKLIDDTIDLVIRVSWIIHISQKPKKYIFHNTEDIVLIKTNKILRKNSEYKLKYPSNMLFMPVLALQKKI